MRRGLITIGAVLALAGFAAADTTVTGTLVQPDALGYVEPAELRIEVVHAPNAAVVFPDPPRLPAMFTLDVREPETEVIDETNVRTTRRYIMDAFGPIRLVIPSLVVKVDNTPYPLPAFVLDRPDISEDDAKNLAAALDIVNPQAVIERNGRPTWHYAAGIAAVIALAGALLWWWSRRRAEATGPKAPPWETARQRLRALKHRKLPEAGKFETYYVDLSAILRYYIEDRLQLRAPEQTTQEFLAAAAESGALTPAQQEALSNFLRQSDRVKFARYRPSVEEMLEDFEVVDHFVTETMPGSPTEEAA